MDYLDLPDLGPETGLSGVFLTYLLGATLLPGGLESGFALYVIRHTDSSGLALALATLGNTLDGDGIQQRLFFAWNKASRMTIFTRRQALSSSDCFVSSSKPNTDDNPHARDRQCRKGHV